MAEEPDPFAQLSDATMTAQMVAFAAFHTVREILVDVAKMQPDPERYVTGLYDRVIGRLDRGPDFPRSLRLGRQGTWSERSFEMP